MTMKRKPGVGKRRSTPSRAQRQVRTQQIIFTILAVIVILSWVIALIAK